MCGRTCLSLNKEQVQCACSYKRKGSNSYVKPDWLPEHNAGKDYTPSHNIAPTDVTPVLVSPSRLNATGMKEGRVLKPMMWGVIPPWHKGDYKNHKMSTNNCRIESIKESKLFSPLLRNGGRCVIIAEGFYEWQTTNKAAKVKQPYYIYSTQKDDVKIEDPKTWSNDFKEDTGWRGIKLLFMAGVYNIWQDGGTIIYSYSVITMESHDMFSWLHHRIPAILDREDQIEAWLDIDNVDYNMALAHLKPVQILTWHPVSTAVNNSKNKSEDCNKRIVKQKSSQKTLSSFFTPSNKRKPDDKESLESKNKRSC